MPNTDESMEFGEQIPTGQPVSNTHLTLQKAIDLGEYKVEVLGMFEEWHKLSRHAQFELIKKAIDNRRKQLWQHWAELNNQLNFSKKPYLQPALDNVHAQIKQLESDNEQLYIEYST